MRPLPRPADPTRRPRLHARIASVAVLLLLGSTAAMALDVINVKATKPTAFELQPDSDNPVAGQITITRSGTSGALTVHFSVAGNNGDATFGGTTSLGGGNYTVTIADGNASVVVPVTPIEDNDVEGAEQLTFALTSDDSYVLGGEPIAVVTIGDDDLEAIPSAPDLKMTERFTDLLRHRNFEDNLKTQGVLRVTFPAAPSTLPNGHARTPIVEFSGEAQINEDYRLSWMPIKDYHYTEAAFAGNWTDARDLGWYYIAPSLTEGDTRLPLTGLLGVDSASSVADMHAGDTILYRNHESLYTIHGFTYEVHLVDPDTGGLQPYAHPTNTITIEGTEVYGSGSPNNTDTPAFYGSVTTVDSGGTNVVQVTPILVHGPLTTAVPEKTVLSNIITESEEIDSDRYELAVQMSSITRAIDYIITPIDDGEAEGGETLKARFIENLDFRLREPNSITMVIADDDVVADVQLVRNAQLPEVAGYAKVRLTAALEQAVDVPFAVIAQNSAGTLTGLNAEVDWAREGTDFETLASSVRIPAGQTEATITIQPISTGAVGTVGLRLLASDDYILAGRDEAREDPDVFVNIVAASGSTGSLSGTGAIISELDQGHVNAGATYDATVTVTTAGITDGQYLTARIEAAGGGVTPPSWISLVSTAATIGAGGDVATFTLRIQPPASTGASHVRFRLNVGYDPSQDGLPDAEAIQDHCIYVIPATAAKPEPSPLGIN